MVKATHKETRKRHYHEASSSEDSDDSDRNNTFFYKSSTVKFHSCSQSSTATSHKDNKTVSITDGEEMNRTLKALQGEPDDIDDREDDNFKELARKLNKEEGLGESVQQTLINILEAIWRNPPHM